MTDWGGEGTHRDTLAANAVHDSEGWAEVREPAGAQLVQLTTKLTLWNTGGGKHQVRHNDRCIKIIIRIVSCNYYFIFLLFLSNTSNFV